MDNLIVIGIVTLAFTVGLFVVPYLQKKGILNKDLVEGITRSTFIAKAVLRVLKLDTELANKTNISLEIADIVADYVGDLLELKPDEDKGKIALDAIQMVLMKLKITPSEDEMELIKIIVNESLAWHDRKEVK